MTREPGYGQDPNPSIEADNPDRAFRELYEHAGSVDGQKRAIDFLQSHYTPEQAAEILASVFVSTLQSNIQEIDDVYQRIDLILSELDIFGAFITSDFFENLELKQTVKKIASTISSNRHTTTNDAVEYLKLLNTRFGLSDEETDNHAWELLVAENKLGPLKFMYHDVDEPTELILQTFFSDKSRLDRKLRSHVHTLITTVKLNELYLLLHRNYALAQRIKNVLPAPEFTQAIQSTLREIAVSDMLHYVFLLADEFGVDRASICSGDETLQCAAKLFGGYIDSTIYFAVEGLVQGSIPTTLQKLGVRKGGKDGLVELEKILKKIGRELVNGNPTPDMLHDTIISRWHKYVIRYESAAWGRHDETAYRETVNRYFTLSQSGKLAPLPEGYESSEPTLIAKHDHKENAERAIDDGALVRYQYFMSAMKAALIEIDEPADAEQEIVRLNALLQNAIQALEATRDRQTSQKAFDHVNTRIARLRSVNQFDLKTREEVEDVFVTLASIDDAFRHVSLKVLFWWTLALHPEQQAGARAAVMRSASGETPTRTDLAWCAEFVEHVARKQTLQPAFHNAAAITQLKKILDTNALTDELRRFQNTATFGKIPLQFIPSRNLLTEFSGHIGDACWANQYDSILQQFPRFTSVTMLAYPGDEVRERLVGSCFLIETEAVDGTPLLVIRGLNPIQNLITQLDAKKFIKEFVVFVRTIAKRRGRLTAMVIDDHSGGCGTNRPELQTLMEEMSAQLSKIRLKDVVGTTFNGYDISNLTYLIDPLSASTSTRHTRAPSHNRSNID